MRLNTKLNILKYVFKLTIYRRNTIDEAVVGINSNLTKNKKEWWKHHFLMLDYDNNLSLDNLEREIKHLQKQFKLGDCHIFESSYKHYNVIFFYEDMDYFEALKIIHTTTSCKSFKSWRMTRQEMTLRLTPKKNYDKKPILINIITSKYNRVPSKEQKKIKNFVLGYLREE